MSYQAFEAIRDLSESTGATRRVGFVLASYADKFGGSVFPSLPKVMEGAKCTRKTAVDARRWFVESGEAEVIDYLPSHTGSSTPVLSFAPLMAKGSLGEPLPAEGFAEDREGFAEDTLRVRQGSSKGSLSEPDTEVETERETEQETEPTPSPPAQEGFLPSGIEQQNSQEPSSTQLEEQQRGEEERLRADLEALKEQRAKARGQMLDSTERCITQLEGELGSLETTTEEAA